MPAPLLRRLAATLIDAFFLACMTLLLLLVTGIMETADAYVGRQPLLRLSGIIITAWLLLNLWTLVRGAQTLGKRLTGLRMVDASGAPLPVWRSLVRPLVTALPLLTPWWWIPVIDSAIGLLPGRRCLHDHVVGSRVIYPDARPAQTPSTEPEPAAAGSPS